MSPDDSNYFLRMLCLQRKSRQRVRRPVGEGHIYIPYLFYFMNESRQRQLQKGDTYYSSMVFHLIQVMNQVSAVCQPWPGQLIPICLASYLTGMGNDRKREYLELAESKGDIQKIY